MTEFQIEKHSIQHENAEAGKIGYLVLWLMGVPAGFLLVMWFLLGNNIFTAG